MAGRGVKVEFNADVARFTSGVDKALNDLARFQSNADRTSKNVNTILANIGVGLSAGGIVAFGKSVIDSLDHLNDLSRTTNLAVGTLAGLGVAAKQSGSDLDSVAASVSKLSVNIGKDGEKFRALGITAKDPLEAFKQLADIFVAIKDPQERAAVAAAALGKSWETTAPLLSEGGAAIGRMVAEGEKASGVTAEMAAEADKFNDQLETMKAKLGGVAVSITGNLLPAMNDMLDKMKVASSTSGGILSYFTASSSEEANAQKTIDDLNQKVESLKKTREELAAPTLGNKVNNSVIWNFLGFGPTDLQIVDSQIAAVQTKINYLKGLVKSSSDVQEAVKPVAAPSKSAIDNFLGNAQSVKQFADSAKQAAAELAKLQKEGQTLAESVDPIIKRNSELGRYVELLNQGVITQDTFDKAATKSITSSQAALDAADSRLQASIEAQKALAALQKEGQSLTESVDPIAKRNSELERYVTLLDAGAISQGTFDKAATASINDAENKLKGSVDDMSSILIGFQSNVQSTLGTGLYNMAKGSFDNILASFSDMLLRMGANAIAANISSKVFGNDGGASFLKAGLSIFSSLSSLGGGAKVPGVSSGTQLGSPNFGQFLWPSAKGSYFDGPVAKFAMGDIFNSPTAFRFASGGALHNGIMGEAGPEAIMPLKRGSDGKLGVSGGGGKSMVINYNPVVNVDSRSDRAGIIQDMQRINKQGQAELVDKLTRQGLI